MNFSFLTQAADAVREKKRYQRWLVMFLCLAAVVALGTVAALRMYGQAMTRKEKILDCIAEVHSHLPECYDDQNGLICGYADYVVHTHNEDCYDPEGVLVCQLAEIEEHIHTDQCYEEQKALICTQEEAEGHIHTDTCYTREQAGLECQLEEHQHTEACYDENEMLLCTLEEHQHADDCYIWEDILTCQLEEDPQGHTHTDECYKTERSLICGLSELHTHNEDCYTEENGERSLTCGLLQLEEHIHGEDCFVLMDRGEEMPEEDIPDPAGEDVSLDEEQPAADITLTEETEEYIIKVSASKEAFPDTDEKDLSLKVVRLESDSEEYQAAQKLLDEKAGRNAPFTASIEEDGEGIPLEIPGMEDNTASQESAGQTDGHHYVFDINVLKKGEDIQPEVPVQVSFKIKAGDGSETVREVTQENNRVFHVDVEKDTAEDMGAVPDGEGNTVIDTSHFSLYSFDEEGRQEHLDKNSWELLKEFINNMNDPNGKKVRITLQQDIECNTNVGDTYGHIWVDAHRDVVLDLNGHTIRTAPGISGSGALFWVGDQNGGDNGGTLTIVDSRSKDFVPTETPIDEKEPGKTGSYDPESKTAVYYVTKSTPDDTGIKTNEKTYRYEAALENVGAIENQSYEDLDTLIKVWANGTLNIAGGRLSNAYGAAIASGAAHHNMHIDLTGGHLIGNGSAKSNDRGGALHLEGGRADGRNSVKIGQKAVIAANKANFAGGGVYLKGSDGGSANLDLKIEKGAVIAGNIVTQEAPNDDPTGGGGVYAQDTDIEMSGGYISNNQGYKSGGGICAKWGGMSFTGGYITANTVSESGDISDGGGIYTTGVYDDRSDDEGINRFLMNGGTIAGNRAKYGGGIWVNKTAGFSGTCYISNNRSTGDSGGIHIHSSEKVIQSSSPNVRIVGNTAAGNGGGIGMSNSKNARLEIENVCIKDNQADGGGGGIYLHTTTFVLKAGLIDGNIAGLEGGGIRVDHAIAEISPDDGQKVYITNNKTTSRNGDWGGGGIFISDGNSDSGRVEIKYALIKDNHAEGFGGGLGGCSTGRIFGVDTGAGAAIYGNHADGEKMSGASSSKHEDHAAQLNEHFMANAGYQDVFSALQCSVGTHMLGGGAENWTGSSDYRPVDTSGDTDINGYISSTAVLGLTANPDAEGISAAEGIARVFITGNSSGTHGGGIMCNGILQFGTKDVFNFDDGLTLNLKKIYKVITSDTDNSLQEGQFHFALLDRSKITDPSRDKLSIQDKKVLYDGKEEGVVSHAYNMDDGKISFVLSYRHSDDRIAWSDTETENLKKAVLQYWLAEVPSTADSSLTITDDATIYPIDVTLCKKETTRDFVSSKTITISYIYVEQVKVGDQVFSDSGLGDYGGELHHRTPILELGNAGIVFRNTSEKSIGFTIEKRREPQGSQTGPGDIMTNIEFTLTKLKADGTKDETVKVQSQTTNNLGRASFSFPYMKGDKYILEEKIPNGYQDAGPWTIEISDDEKLIFTDQTGKELTPSQSSTPGNTIMVYAVKNIPIRYELPETGGPGGIPVYTAVLLLMSAAALLGYKKTKGRKEGTGR